MTHFHVSTDSDLAGLRAHASDRFTIAEAVPDTRRPDTRRAQADCLAWRRRLATVLFGAHFIHLVAAVH